jgi:hypothetical protein
LSLTHLAFTAIRYDARFVDISGFSEFTVALALAAP